MLGAREAYGLILGLVMVNDWDIFDEVASKHPTDFPRSVLPIYRAVGDIVSRLVEQYDFTRSVAFEESVVGKSAAYRAMKLRFESDPVKVKAHVEAFVAALGEICDSDQVLALLPPQQHSAVEENRRLIQKCEERV